MSFVSRKKCTIEKSFRVEKAGGQEEKEEESQFEGGSEFECALECKELVKFWNWK